MMPPEHTEMPAFCAWLIVCSRSSYVRVEIILMVLSYFVPNIQACLPYLGIEFTRSIKVVVISCQTRFLKLFGLSLVQHAKRAAHFHAHATVKNLPINHPPLSPNPIYRFTG